MEAAMMEAGPEMDRLVESEVMKDPVWSVRGGGLVPMDFGGKENAEAVQAKFKAERPEKDYRVCWRARRPYSTDATADYAVLEKVRELCGEDHRRSDFRAALADIWYARARSQSDRPLLDSYQPGDYSRAALTALATQG